MTRSELLASVVANIPVLLHDNADALKELCISAIEEYQARAGYFQEIEVTEADTEVLLPDNFIQVVNSMDSGFISAEARICKNTDGKNVVVIVNTDSWSTAPFKVTCLVDIVGTSADIPQESHLHLKKYLRVLIDIPNTERLYASRASAGLPFDGLPSIEGLEAKKLGLEDEMTLSGHMIMPELIM